MPALCRARHSRGCFTVHGRRHTRVLTAMSSLVDTKPLAALWSRARRLASQWTRSALKGIHEATAFVADQTPAHPVLGDVARDVTYKRVFFTSISALQGIPVWNRQRTLSQERAVEISQHLKQVQACTGEHGSRLTFASTATSPPGCDYAV